MFFAKQKKLRARLPGKAPGGGAIVEGVVALVLLLPLFLLSIYVVVETSTFFAIRNHLSLSAHNAARNMVIAYWKDSRIATDRSAQDAQVFDHIRCNNYVNDSSQFEDAAFNLDTEPHSVSVTCRYAGGENNLPPFPNPDPLGLGPINLSVSATQSID